MSHLFTGSGVAVTTPFRDGEVDYESFRTHLNFLKANNTQAFVVNGTTGEGTTLSDEEEHKLYEISVEIANGEIPVIAGTGSNNTAKAIKMSQKAESYGVDGLLIITPYYNKTSQRGLIEHFTAIADAVNIPIILYDVPSRTNMKIKPETLQHIANHENIIGLKDATGDLVHLSECQQLVDSSFAFYGGNDNLALPFFAQGGSGIISVVANVLPNEMQELFKASSENIMYAQELHHKLFPLIKWLEVDVNPIPIKILTNFLGFGEYELRLPLVPLDEIERIPIIEAFRRLKEGDE